MENELWAPVVGHPSYEVSNFGRVVNVYSGHEKKPTLNAYNGYLYVYLWTDGKPRTCLLHRLVAQAFVAGFSPELDVNHLDGDKTNAAAYNLEWVTRGDNHRHAYRTGLRGPVRPHMRPIKCCETDDIFDSISECARFLGMNFSSVSNQLAGRRSTVHGFTFEYV